MPNTGRPRKLKEGLTERIPIYVSETFNKTLRSYAETTSRDLSEIFRTGAEREISGESEPSEPDEIEIPLLGYIPGGESFEARPFSDHATVSVPSNFKGVNYCLVVIGDSMKSDFGMSIPDGSYALFNSDAQPSFNSIVHVEWETAPDSGVNCCTLKRFCPQADGSAVFEPLNKKHKAITRAANTFNIKGVFVRPWDGKSA